MTVYRTPFRTGITLLELMVAISIIAILLSILIGGVQSVRIAFGKMACANNARQIGLACQSYHSQNGKFPARWTDLPNKNRRQDTYTWPTLLLPFIEQDTLWRAALEAHQTGVFDYENPPHAPLATVVKVYACPWDTRLSAPITDDKELKAAYGSYWGTLGPGPGEDGVIRNVRGVQVSEIADGSSNTVMIGERPPQGKRLSGNWYTEMVKTEWTWAADWTGGGMSTMRVVKPGDLRCSGPIVFGPGQLDNICDYEHFWSFHSSGANFLFADGAVRFLPYSARDILPALATRSGGEIAELP